MKVYLIPAAYDGCAYVRCLLPQIHNGWWGAMRSLATGKESNEQMFAGAKEADIVMFQRPMQLEMFEAAKILQQMGKKIVFDNDDTYKSNSGFPRLMGEIMERQVDTQIINIDARLKQFAKNADLVTVTTQFLADEYKEVTDKIVVIPNMVDPDDWDKPKRNKGNKVRIGIVGSAIMNNDSKVITGILRRLGKRDDVQLVILGIPSAENTRVRKFYMHEIAYWNTMNVEWHPSVHVSEYMTKLNDMELDIMLIPRADNYFNRCKSNVKFLEASMCEIPVIAQGFEDGKSPYQDPEDALHMLVPVTEDEWEQEIESLISSKEVRREMGKDARKYVLKNYNIQKTYKLWADAYKKIL